MYVLKTQTFSEIYVLKTQTFSGPHDINPFTFSGFYVIKINLERDISLVRNLGRFFFGSVLTNGGF